MTKDAMVSLIVKILLMVLTPLAAKYHVDGSTTAAIATDLADAAVLLYGIYSHWNMKKVPDNSLAVATVAPVKPEMIGKTVNDLTGKVVGALLAGLFLFGSTHYIQAQPAPKTPAINSLALWADQDLTAAIALAAIVPEIQDGIGQACWKTFQGIASVLKAHPLPLTLKLASDIEAARLVAMGLNRICSDPNCSQVWNDMTNTVAAMSVLPAPLSLTSVCAKIPLVKSSPASATDANGNPDKSLPK